MSHQSGIRCNEELLSLLSKSKTQSNNLHIRLIKISNRNGELILEECKDPIEDWQSDYTMYVQHMVLGSEPVYILFRLDSEDPNGAYEWVLIVWIPEGSSGYASTKAYLKEQFGGNIKHVYFATTLEEISFNGLNNWLTSRVTKLALTREGTGLSTVESRSSFITTINESVSGLKFPIDSKAINALFDLKDDNLSYVQLGIDVHKEEIKLENKKTSNELDVRNIQAVIPEKSSRYHLIVFRHTFEGQFTKSIVFVYSMTSSSVKEGMLYSSFKNSLINAITDRIGIQIDKLLEISNPRELTHDFLMDVLHPKPDTDKDLFVKPEAPVGKRGGKRLIKTIDNL